MHMQGLETLSQLNGQANEDLSEREQQSLQSYPLSLRILAQDSGVKLSSHSWELRWPSLLSVRVWWLLVTAEPSKGGFCKSAPYGCRPQRGV
jgi:hypothetical protein